METQKCLFPDCGRDRLGRGLCANHYSTAKRLVAQNKTTWEKMEKAGKTLPARSNVSAPVSTWFLGRE